MKLKYDFAEAHYNLANLLTDLKQFKEAETAYKKAIKFKPDYAEAYCNLGAVLVELGKLSEAEKACARATEIRSDYAAAYYNLGNALLRSGQVDGAESAYRRSISLNPDNLIAQSNLLFAMNYNLRYSGLQLLEEALAYGRLASNMVKQPYASWRSELQPAKLKVGFVSGDLGEHPVGFFLEGMLSHIDRSRVELFAYNTTMRSDELASRIKPLFSGWRSLHGLSDKAAAELIHADCIHVLFDLSGHTAQNRLTLFAWKSAPVQVTWLGYSGTSGLEQVDYVLGDPYVTPDGEQDNYSEKIWQLPESFLCFSQPQVPVVIKPSPHSENGLITFGCFNNLVKINREVILLWAAVLRSVPGSKLLIRNESLKDDGVCQRVVGWFEECNLGVARLVLDSSYTSRDKLFEAYSQIDIALDPFPYNGTTTTVESLWMGVPVLTLKGDRFIAHVGESILNNVGLPGWIAADKDDYVAKAVRFASDIDGLARLRAGLRQQLLASPVCDTPRFARHFEDALWGMWQARSNQAYGDNVTQ